MHWIRVWRISGGSTTPRYRPVEAFSEFSVVSESQGYRVRGRVDSEEFNITDYFNTEQEAVDVLESMLKTDNSILVDVRSFKTN